MRRRLSPAERSVRFRILRMAVVLLIIEVLFAWTCWHVFAAQDRARACYPISNFDPPGRSATGAEPIQNAVSGFAPFLKSSSGIKFWAVRGRPLRRSTFRCAHREDRIAQSRLVVSGRGPVLCHFLPSVGPHFSGYHNEQ